MKNSGAIVAATLLAGAVATSASAGSVNITIENTSASGGFSFTPVWLALHNGGFDSYDGGALASGFPGLEEIAEAGDTGPISAAFTASPAGASGVQATLAEPNGAPVFSPGESASITLDTVDPTINRYFSYASMVVPSNDLFFANGNPFAHEVFDAAGNFNGAFEILIFGSDVNDAGTEVNDAAGGAAFSSNGGVSADESILVRNLFTDAGDEAYLASFLGSDTVDGGSISSVFGSGDLIARITVTPTPGAAAPLALAGMAGMIRRRR